MTALPILYWFGFSQLLQPQPAYGATLSEVLAKRPAGFIAYSKDSGRHFDFLNAEGKVVYSAELPDKFGSVSISPNGQYLAASISLPSMSADSKGKSWLTIADKAGVVYEAEIAANREFRWHGGGVVVLGSNEPTTKIQRDESGVWSEKPFLSAKALYSSAEKIDSFWFIREDVPKGERRALAHVGPDGTIDQTLPQRSEFPAKIVAAKDGSYILYVDFDLRLVGLDTKTKKEKILSEDQYGKMAANEGTASYIDLKSKGGPSAILLDTKSGKRKDVLTKGAFPWEIYSLGPDAYLVCTTPVKSSWKEYWFYRMDAKTGEVIKLDSLSRTDDEFPICGACF